MPSGFELCGVPFRISRGQARFLIIIMIKYYKCTHIGGHLLIIFALFNREKVADP